MKRIEVVLTAMLALSALSACKNDGAESSEPAAKKRAPKKSKDAGSEADLDLAGLYAGDAPYGGSLDVFGDVTFGVAEHSAVEPERFSAGWVGRESWDVLQRARKGELPHKQVRMSDGRVCLVFTEGNIVRRAMVVKSATSPSEEMAFSAAGGLIFWYRNSRSKPLRQEWAYFHRNTTLERFETQNEGEARGAATPGPYDYGAIVGAAQQCVSAAGAANPPPGTALAPAPAPAQNAYFGAMALDKADLTWRVAYNHASEEAARQRALAACGRPACEVRNVFTTGRCLSVLKASNSLSWGTGSDNNQAFASALEACVKSGRTAKECVEQGTWCNNAADSGRAAGPSSGEPQPSDGSGSGDPPPTAPPPPAAPPPAPPPPPPAPAADAFTKVDAAAWQPRLGPKMKVGSRVVHDVFEGPFGPSPKSLFAITERLDQTFWIYVMGDDNRPWPAGPCAEEGLDLANKAVAVSFFDADGDGTLDALVMLAYHTSNGDGPYHKNILLRWTPLGLRRLLNLEPKIRSLTSVAAVRQALGR